jgi:hypothetical protein
MMDSAFRNNSSWDEPPEGEHREVVDLLVGVNRFAYLLRLPPLQPNLKGIFSVEAS